VSADYRDGERPSWRESPSAIRLVTVEQKIDNLIARDNDRHAQNSEKLEAILEQATKTNGRVNALEAWKDKISGGFGALILVSGLLGFLFKILWDHLLGK
jgi:hypothetical protein